MPSAAAPIISPCSAMRFLSRQVICRIGSMPAPMQDRRGRQRAHMGAGAGAVGDVDRIGEPAERRRLAQEVLRVAGHAAGRPPRS